MDRLVYKGLRVTTAAILSEKAHLPCLIPSYRDGPQSEWSALQDMDTLVLRGDFFGRRAE